MPDLKETGVECSWQQERSMLLGQIQHQILHDRKLGQSECEWPTLGMTLNAQEAPDNPGAIFRH